MTNDGSPDDEDIVDKRVGFAQYASPKKHSGCATDGSATDDRDDGFAKLKFKFNLNFRLFQWIAIDYND